MTHFLKLFCFLIVSISLASCGGGGGGGSTSGGTPAPVATDTLNLSTGAITFSVTQFETTPDPVTVTARITGSNTAGIAFGTLPGVDSLPSWLSIDLGTLVNNSVDAVFNITTSDLPAGTYNFTVRAVTFDSSERALDTADVVVTFQVAEGIPLSLSPQSVDVVMHYASDPIEQVISVTAGNYEWIALSSDANLDIDGATGSEDVTLSIFPPSEDIVDDMGMYQGVVDVFQNSTSNNEIFLINFTMFPTLDYFGNDIFLNAVAGNSDSEEVGVNLRGEGLNWTASSDQPWVSFSAESGTIITPDDFIDSPDGDDFSVNIDASTLAEGPHEAVLTITAEADQTLDIPIRVEVASQKLKPMRRAIAFSQTQEGSALQTFIDIQTNADRVVNWEASTGEGWLSVTPSGTTNDQLIVTADASALPNEVFSGGAIRLSSPDSEISEIEIINVGVWKSAQMAATDPIATGGFNSEVKIVTDPLRPFSYVNPDETMVSVYNNFSGALIGTINIGAAFAGMDVSDDGEFLYVARSGDDVGFVDVIDLNTRSVFTTWEFPVERALERDRPGITFGRVSGEPYVFTTSQKIISTETGEVVADFALSTGQVEPTVITVENETLCAVDRDVACSSVTSAGFGGARVRTQILGEETFSNSFSTMPMTLDGAKVYLPDFRTINVLGTADVEPISTLDNGTDFVEELNISTAGQLYATFLNEDDIANPVRRLIIYDTEDDSIVRTLNYPSRSGGLVPPLNDVGITGDERRIIYMTDDGFLELNFFSLD